MRSKLGKLLRARFDEMMKSRLPSFRPDHEAIAPPGCRVYASTLRPGSRAFISLTISPKDDGFTVEIAWSPHGKYPHSTITAPDERSSDGDSRFRLGHLFGTREDYWWYLAKRISLDDEFFTFEEDSIDLAISRIEPALEETFEKIESYAIPYFDQMSRTVDQ